MHAYFMAPLRCPAAMRKKAGALCGGYLPTKGNIAQDGEIVDCPECIKRLTHNLQVLRDVYANPTHKPEVRQQARETGARINLLLPEKERAQI